MRPLKKKENRRSYLVKSGAGLFMALALLCPGSAHALSRAGPWDTVKMIGKCAFSALDGPAYVWAAHDFHVCLANADAEQQRCSRDAVSTRINCFRMRIRAGQSGEIAQRICAAEYAVDSAACDALYQTDVDRCTTQFVIDAFDVFLPSVGPFGPAELLQMCAEMDFDEDGRSTW